MRQLCAVKREKKSCMDPPQKGMMITRPKDQTTEIYLREPGSIRWGSRRRRIQRGQSWSTEAVAENSRRKKKLIFLLSFLLGDVKLHNEHKERRWRENFSFRSLRDSRTFRSIFFFLVGCCVSGHDWRAAMMRFLYVMARPADASAFLCSKWRLTPLFFIITSTAHTLYIRRQHEQNP